MVYSIYEIYQQSEQQQCRGAALYQVATNATSKHPVAA